MRKIKKGPRITRDLSVNEMVVYFENNGCGASLAKVLVVNDDLIVVDLQDLNERNGRLEHFKCEVEKRFLYEMA